MSLEDPNKPIIAKEPVNKYLKFSGLAFQLMAAILLGYFIGHWVDKRVENDTPYWTAGLILLFLCAYLVTMIRSLSKKE